MPLILVSLYTFGWHAWRDYTQHPPRLLHEAADNIKECHGECHLYSETVTTIYNDICWCDLLVTPFYTGPNLNDTSPSNAPLNDLMALLPESSTWMVMTVPGQTMRRLK